jgi:nicotinamide/nicotinate riboside kinase
VYYFSVHLNLFNHSNPQIRKTGIIPPEHYSHDHLNEQKDVPVASDTVQRWRDVFTKIQEERKQAGEAIVWVLVDGFLLYWDQVRAKLVAIDLFQSNSFYF